MAERTITHLVQRYEGLVAVRLREEERDRASSRGWAWGYIGGGLLLLINLVMVLGHSSFGIDKEMMVRLSLLSAGLWWAAFTFIPYLRLQDHPEAVADAPPGGAQAGASSGTGRSDEAR